jgi:5-methylcytosine-specific restriction endonuclease McrA
MGDLNCLSLSDYLCKRTLRKRKRQAIYEAFGHSCAYCGGRAESLDHIKPRMKGGTEDFSNLAASCLRCNGLKGHQDVWDFYTKQKFYCKKRAAFLQVWMNLEVFNGLLPLSYQELPLGYLLGET